MPEYIDREKVIDAVFAAIADGRAIFPALNNLPAADVRPVVLCRDCTFFKPQQKSKRWSNTTPMCSRSATIKMPPDGFCSFGVKREES